MMLKCALDPRYNVCCSQNLPTVDVTAIRQRQALSVGEQQSAKFIVKFIREALPTKRKYCEYFGLDYAHKDNYTVEDRGLCAQ